MWSKSLLSHLAFFPATSCKLDWWLTLGWLHWLFAYRSRSLSASNKQVTTSFQNLPKSNVVPHDGPVAISTSIFPVFFFFSSTERPTSTSHSIDIICVQDMGNYCWATKLSTYFLANWYGKQSIHDGPRFLWVAGMFHQLTWWLLFETTFLKTPGNIG